MESEKTWNEFKSHFQASNCDLCKMVTTAIHGDYNSTVKMCMTPPLEQRPKKRMTWMNNTQKH